MNYLNKILIISCFIFVLCACKKDSYEPEVSDVPCLLTKVTTVYPEASITQNFEYDKYRRLVEVTHADHSYYTIEYDKFGRIKKSVFYKNGEPGSLLNYSWENSHVHVEKKIIKTGNFEVPEKWDYYLNDEGQLVKQSTYTYEYDKWLLQSDEIYTWENGNITAKDRYFISGNVTVRHYYKYDDKRNIYSSYGISHLWEMNTLTTNNMIKEEQIWGDAETVGVEFNYQYEYNDRGYPSRCHIAMQTQNLFIEGVLEYNYECL